MVVGNYVVGALKHLAVRDHGNACFPAACNQPCSYAGLIDRIAKEHRTVIFAHVGKFEYIQFATGVFRSV